MSEKKSKKSKKKKKKKKMGKSTSCFKIITCGDDSADKDDLQVSEVSDWFALFVSCIPIFPFDLQECFFFGVNVTLKSSYTKI